MSKNDHIQEYVVESILDKRFDSKGDAEYLIKWEDYPKEEATWEPSENVQCVKNLLEQFEKNLVKKQQEEKEKEISKIIFEHLQDSTPSKILSVKTRKNQIVCFCEFEQESTGITRDPCYIPSKFLKEHFPKILIDYYESKIWFIQRKEK